MNEREGSGERHHVRGGAFGLARLKREACELREHRRLVDVRHALAVRAPVHCERLLQMRQGGGPVAASLGDACELLQRRRAPPEGIRPLRLHAERLAQQRAWGRGGERSMGGEEGEIQAKGEAEEGRG